MSLHKEIDSIQTLVSEIWWGLIEGKRQFLYYQKRKRCAYVLDRVVTDPLDPLLASFGPNDYTNVTSTQAKNEIYARISREVTKIIENGRIPSQLGCLQDAMRKNDPELQ